MKNLIQKLKTEAGDISVVSIPIKKGEEVMGRLRPITFSSIENEKEVEMLANWRRNNQEFFTTQFHVTAEGTKKWLKEKILSSEKHILFIVEDHENHPVGHLGLCDMDFQKRICLFDNILRGDSNRFKGGMYDACFTLLNWCFHTLNMETVSLKVLVENDRAIKLYKKLGFKEIEKIPLMKRIEKGTTKWIPLEKGHSHKAERYLFMMSVSREGGYEHD